MLARAPRIPAGPAWTLLAVVVALISLPFGHALAFDASAWVVWGRELWSLGIDTGAGPSWKPFPVLFTAPFAALGDASGAAWLVVARAGGLLAVIGAARLAARVAGPWAVPVTVAAIVLSPWWLLNAALGNADPLLGGLVVWALLALTEQRWRSAFWLLTAGALVRPEIWPFLAGYALWLLVRGRISLGPVLGAAGGVLALWVVPDLLSSGLSSTTGATGTPSAGSAGLTDVPFLTVWADLVEQGPWPVLLAAVLGAVFALRSRGAVRRDAALWLGLAGAYVLLVAVMAQVGFAGNPRYLVPALTVIAAVAGTVVVVAGPGRWAPPLLAAVVVASIVAVGWGELRDQGRVIEDRADRRTALVDLVDTIGGRAEMKRCGPVRTDPVIRTIVAELLREPIPVAGGRGRDGDADVRIVDAGVGLAWRFAPGAC